jgi:hypothetical protein
MRELAPCVRPHRRAGTAAAAAAPEQSDTAIVVRRLGEHWRKGEQRAIHRRPYVRRKPVAARPSMLDPHIPFHRGVACNRPTPVGGRHTRPPWGVCARPVWQKAVAYGATAGQEVASESSSPAHQPR